MHGLPVEMWLKVFEQTPSVRDLIMCTMTCRRFRAAIRFHLSYLHLADPFLNPGPTTFEHLFKAEQVRNNLGAGAAQALSAVLQAQVGPVRFRSIHPSYPTTIVALNPLAPNLLLQSGDHIFCGGGHAIVDVVNALPLFSTLIDNTGATPTLYQWLNGCGALYRLEIHQGGSSRERTDYPLGPNKTGRPPLPLPAHPIAHRVLQIPPGTLNQNGWTSGQFCFFCQTGGWIDDDRLAAVRSNPSPNILQSIP